MKVSTLQINHIQKEMKPGGVHQVERVTPHKEAPSTGSVRKPFTDILAKRILNDNSLRFSAHATERIHERNISLNPSQLARLEQGLGRVKEKGAKSSLILMDKMAYIVSVKNQTVVTALSEEATHNNVFTNIDSVAIV
ncbi:flagellar protein [Caldithrix abyssi]|nr:flagellar protein [Caldithrix abyssi]